MFKKFFTHYVLYAALLLLLCVGIFPFIILYSSSTSVAGLMDRLVSGTRFATALDTFWSAIGRPYDLLVKTVG